MAFRSELAIGVLRVNRTPFSGVPMLNGRPIDLHKLYLTVCTLGGCRKVSRRGVYACIVARALR